MAWTTPATATAGSTALTAAFWNEQVRDNTNFLYTPPMVQVRRTTNLTSYTSASAITWESEAFDTDSMWSSGTTVTVNTAGIYLVTFSGFASGAATITLINPVVLRGADLALTTNVNINAGINAYFTVSGTLKFTAAQTVTARVDFTGGSAYVVGGSGTEGIGQTRLSLTWIAKD